jgi:hypothetical protein
MAAQSGGVFCSLARDQPAVLPVRPGISFCAYWSDQPSGFAQAAAGSFLRCPVYQLMAIVSSGTTCASAGGASPAAWEPVLVYCDHRCTQ